MRGRWRCVYRHLCIWGVGYGCIKGISELLVVLLFGASWGPAGCAGVEGLWAMGQLQLEAPPCAQDPRIRLGAAPGVCAELEILSEGCWQGQSVPKTLSNTTAPRPVPACH